ncbi:MAG: mechanosensitive ion channel family protein [bacterium]|nr:mechanosensitive ion channel family protein [bacterium]
MEILNFIFTSIMKFITTHTPFIMGIIVNAILIGVICKAIDLFTNKLEAGLLAKHPDSSLINLMPICKKLLKAIVIFILLAGFLQSFGYNVSSLIAGFGITGLAVGFAAKEAIGNVFGSIGLLGDRVYKIGEYISFNGYEGTVEKINFRSTTIRTVEGTVVNVPNNVLANEEITNVSQANQRRIDISVDVEYGTSDEKIEQARNLLLEIANDNSEIKAGAIAFIDGLAPSSIVIRLVAYTNKTAWADLTMVKNDVYREIIKRYRENGIEFAFPSTSVYMAK